MDDSHWARIRHAEEGDTFAEGFGQDRDVKFVYSAAKQGSRHDIAAAKHPKSFRSLR